MTMYALENSLFYDDRFYLFEKTIEQLFENEVDSIDSIFLLGDVLEEFFLDIS